MKQWHDVMQKVMEHGDSRPDRTGIGTLALFGEQLVFGNYDHEFPAVTTKKLGFTQVLAELTCFLRGYDNLSQFHSVGCTIWDGNGNAEYWTPRKDGDLGRIYGVQWRDWRSSVRTNHGLELSRIDQLQMLLDGIKQDPYGRHHLVTAWNPGELKDMCLPPCHVLFQAFVSSGYIDLRVDMRSVDLFLGLPFDIASYAVLQRLLAKETGYKSGRLIFQLGDAHIYRNHLDAAREVLDRPFKKLPDIIFTDKSSLFDFSPDDACLVGYDPHPAVKAKLNV